ncbi:MAG: zf-HC2 domain-containing protein [Deltaproteobacteria bacterium]|nr:zf-HC2 domain-containing protein [Deltaproteobacteria bacterium]
MTCKEAQEPITALIDNELSDSESFPLEGHLKDCVRCQFAYRQEQALKRAIRMAGTAVSPPPELREKILSALGMAPQKDEAPKRWEWSAWAAKLMLRPALVFALLVLLFLPTVYLSLRPKEPSIPIFAMQSHKNIVEGALPFVKEASQERVKEQLLRSVEGQFTPMGYDLSTMGLQAVRGVMEELGGRKILVTIYEGEAPPLTCYTFLGTEKDTPDNAAVVFDPDKKINFYTFSHRGVNGVLHREGKRICILVSKMPMGELLALARSKAQPS